MPLMQWDDTMSMGVAELDAQHQQLIELINQAYKAIQRLDSRALPGILDRMHEYAREHFRDEEAAMDKAGFPGLADPIEQHAAFIQQVREFRKNLHDIADIPQVFIYLSRWLTNHILVEDKKLMPYLPT